MTQATYSNLTVEVRKTADGEYYDFGVWIEGVFVIFFKRKSGGLDDAIAVEVEALKTRDAEAATQRAADDQAARDKAVADAASAAGTTTTP